MDLSAPWSLDDFHELLPPPCLETDDLHNFDLLMDHPVNAYEL
jgi:hypothetical protein